MSVENLDIESDSSRNRAQIHNTQYNRRASDDQKEYLVDFMSRHLSFANNISEMTSFSIITTKCERADLWQKLTHELNSLPGTYKDVARWKKCWVDLRINAKAKYKKIQQRKEDKTRTLGRDSLTCLDDRIMKIITSCPSTQFSDSLFEDSTTELEKCEEDNTGISENTFNIPENVTVKVEILEESENTHQQIFLNAPTVNKIPSQKEKTHEADQASSIKKRKPKHNTIYKKLRKEITDLKGTLLKDLFQYKKDKLELERQKMQLEAERIQLKREKFAFAKYSITERNKIEFQKVNALINISGSINSLAERSAVFSVTESGNDFYQESEVEI